MLVWVDYNVLCMLAGLLSELIVSVSAFLRSDQRRRRPSSWFDIRDSTFNF